MSCCLALHRTQVQPKYVFHSQDNITVRYHIAFHIPNKVFSARPSYNIFLGTSFLSTRVLSNGIFRFIAIYCVKQMGLFLHRTTFSMSSMIFPYLCQSAMYRNNIAKNSSAAFFFTSSKCSPLFSVLPWLLSLSDLCIAPVDHILV